MALPNDFLSMSYEQVASLLKYEEGSGTLVWLPRPREMFATERSWLTWNTRFSGRPALTALDTGGYCHGRILRKRYKAHRVAWLLFHKEWPRHEIDHIDGVKTNNRIDNLRDCTGSVNSKNRGRQKNSTSGVSGVSWCPSRSKWEAYFYSERVKTSLGYFPTKEEASRSRNFNALRNGFTERHEGL